MSKKNSNKVKLDRVVRIARSALQSAKKWHEADIYRQGKSAWIDHGKELDDALRAIEEATKEHQGGRE